MLLSNVTIAKNLGENPLNTNSFDMARLGQRLLHHPALNGTIARANTVISDFDDTLIKSKEIWHGFNMALAEKLGISDEDILRAMHDRLHGQSKEVYVRAFYRVCCELGAKVDEASFLDLRKEMVNKGLAAVEVSQVPDAKLLLSIVKHLGMRLHVATHSPRAMAEHFAKLAGYEGLWDFRAEMTCETDCKFNKSNPRYWKEIFNGTSLEGCVALEDTPRGAWWLLRSGIGLVIARPSCEHYLGKFVALRKKFPERVCIVQEFGDLF